MMKILLGTSNPAKVQWFAQMLEDYPVELLTLRDLGIEKVPDEDGATPQENAVRKALWYGQYCDRVITNDSGLYLLSLPLDDPRQPGLFVRRAPDGHAMTDDEMIAHYSALIDSLGGSCLATYLSGYGIYREGKTFGYMDDIETQKLLAFRFVSKPHPTRHPGWPLDSLSINGAGKYFVEAAADQHYLLQNEETARRQQEAAASLRRFLAESLGLVSSEES